MSEDEDNFRRDAALAEPSLLIKPATLSVRKDHLLLERNPRRRGRLRSINSFAPCAPALYTRFRFVYGCAPYSVSFHPRLHAQFAPYAVSLPARLRPCKVS